MLNPRITGLRLGSRFRAWGYQGSPTSKIAAINLFLPPGLSHGLLDLPLELLMSNFIRVNTLVSCPNILILGINQFVTVPRPARIEQTPNFVPERNNQILTLVSHG
jgi:hypothetical protein